MAAIKIVLLFAALSVASVSADTNLQQQWETGVSNLQNISQKFVADLHQVTNSELINSFKANLTHILDTAKEQAEKAAGEVKTDVLAFVEKANNTLMEKIGSNAHLNTEALHDVAQLMSSQFSNISSAVGERLNEVKQLLLPSMQEVTSVVNNVFENVKNVTSSS